MSIRALYLVAPLVSAAFSLAALAASCAPAPLPPPPAPLPPPPPPDLRPPPPPPAWTYWSAVDATVHPVAVAAPLPIAEADLVTLDGASSRWAALPPDARAAVLQRGFAVVPRAAPTARFADAYGALAEARVPYVVTLDALFWVAHVARDRALAAAENGVLAPALGTLLSRLEARLASDVHGAPSDLLAAFSLARGVVSVAQSLLSPAYQPPVDLARVVAEENRRIAAHEGPSASPLLGVTVDYSQIVPRGDADASAARAAYARAVAWLDAAPLRLAARGEVARAELSISAARAHTRAALLLARLVDFNVDVETANAWYEWRTLGEMVGGASDALSLHALLDAAVVRGMSATSDRAFVNVAKLDRLRHALVATHGARADTSARVLGFRAAADAEVLQSLVFPSVGGAIPTALDAGTPETQRDGVRALPRALDIGAWLGSTDARALLHAAGDDAYERYDAILDALIERRPAEALRHDSLYASSLDALATYLAPSAADPTQPAASTDAWRRRKLEGTLAGWVTLRHDALAFARFPLATTAPPPVPSRRSGEDAFVEPHPEAIAKLVALVRQTSQGLRALGDLSPDSPASPILDAAERILVDALAIARREADDVPLTPEDHDALATMPDRFAALEASLAPSRAADASLAVDVHTNLPSARALVEAVGDLDDLYVAFREPQTGRLVLAAGATVSHYEVTEHARDRPTDTVWRSRLHGPSPPPRADYTRAFLVPLASPAAEPLDASLAD